MRLLNALRMPSLFRKLIGMYRTPTSHSFSRPLSGETSDGPTQQLRSAAYTSSEQPQHSNGGSLKAPRPRYDRATSSYHTARYSFVDDQEADLPQLSPLPRSRTPTMSSTASAHQKPELALQFDGVTGDFLDDESESPDSAPAVKQPRSPAGQKFTSFFGWKSSSHANGAESPTTTISDRSPQSDYGAPFARPQIDGHNFSKLAPSAIDVHQANAAGQQSYFNVPGTPLLSSSPGMNAHVEELERELREVSTELAISIKREMELEDELERWKMDNPPVAMEGNRRTSDYYSDSGASSARYGIGDAESKLDEVERLRRQVEQEKASLKVEMARRTQDELRSRRDLEAQVQSLEDQLHQQTSRQPSAEESDRQRSAEASLEDMRRRLAEERQVKENFEDLLTALREELEHHRNERDNLRDEVVPQLRARLEGLEVESGETQKLTYENARMQQELETLRNENQTLVNARRIQAELQQQQNRFKSIAEEGEAPLAEKPRAGLSRSNSLARSSVIQPRRGSLSRSNSVKDRPESPRESIADRVKDVEEQRDALHRALKSMLLRQDHQAKEHAKKIKELEAERDRALSASTRRTAYNKEVAILRDEVNILRRRADDALEQKWQCEKGLSGLHMDLDRARQETSSLRGLLGDRQFAAPGHQRTTSDDDLAEGASLDKALQELQTTHALSLARIREMGAEDAQGFVSADAERTLELLKQSISDAEVERNNAQKEAAHYRQQAQTLQQSEIAHLSKEQSLASELYASANRMDELASQIQQQLNSNKLLRQRLTEAINRGEQEQKMSAARIAEMQSKLRSLEDEVTSAQQNSEMIVSKHEDEVRELREAHNAQLQRARAGLLTPNRYPSSPLSPLFGLRSPRLNVTSSGPGVSSAEATKTEQLQKRVADLEKALSDADREMEEVVGRMNMAQIEVAELQTER